MEDDPNKKESKGKRLLKKALRRSSKSSNNSQSSTADSVTVSRSRSENKRLSIDSRDRAPLPAPGGTKPAADANGTSATLKAESRTRPSTRLSLSRNNREARLEKVVEIQEERNISYPPDDTGTSKGAKAKSPRPNEGPLELGGDKKRLKRVGLRRLVSYLFD